MKSFNYLIGKTLLLTLFMGLVGCGGHSITIGGINPDPVNIPAPPQSGRIQDIAYTGGGKIIQYRDNDVIAQGKTRVCLINRTGQPKMIKWIRILPQGKVNHMSAPYNGAKSCVTIPNNQRIEFTFRDRGNTVRKDAMTLSNWSGELVTFDWVKDNNYFETGSTAPSAKLNCGGKNKRPCKVWERIPSCNAGLTEYISGICR